jgi:hypothetical protein
MISHTTKIPEPRISKNGRLSFKKKLLLFSCTHAISKLLLPLEVTLAVNISLSPPHDYSTREEQRPPRAT